MGNGLWNWFFGDSEGENKGIGGCPKDGGFGYMFMYL